MKKNLIGNKIKYGMLLSIASLIGLQDALAYKIHCPGTVPPLQQSGRDNETITGYVFDKDGKKITLTTTQYNLKLIEKAQPLSPPNGVELIGPNHNFLKCNYEINGTVHHMPYHVNFSLRGRELFHNCQVLPGENAIDCP